MQARASDSAGASDAAAGDTDEEKSRQLTDGIVEAVSQVREREASHIQGLSPADLCASALWRARISVVSHITVKDAPGLIAILYRRAGAYGVQRQAIDPIHHNLHACARGTVASG